MPKRKELDSSASTTTTKRVVMPPFLVWLQQTPGTEATYTWESHKAAGSKKVVATLRPKSLLSKASDADPDLPVGIGAARLAYPKYHFKAGHMLNAELGGPGKRADNLTILTASANTAMKKYDDKLKEAVSGLQHLYNLYHAAKVAKISDVCKNCIEVTIEVSGTKWGKNPPDCYIDESISIDAKFVRARVPPKDFRCDPPDVPDALDDIKTQEGRITTLCNAASGKVDNSG